MITISEYHVQKEILPFVRLHDEYLSSKSDVDFAILVPVFSVCLFSDVIIVFALFRFLFNLIPSDFGIILIVDFVVVRNDFLRKDL